MQPTWPKGAVSLCKGPQNHWTDSVFGAHSPKLGPKKKYQADTPIAAVQTSRVCLFTMQKGVYSSLPHVAA